MNHQRIRVGRAKNLVLVKTGVIMSAMEPQHNLASISCLNNKIVLQKLRNISCILEKNPFKTSSIHKFKAFPLIFYFKEINFKPQNSKFVVFVNLAE